MSLITVIIFNILGGIATCNKANFGCKEDLKKTATIHYFNQTVQANVNSAKVNNGFLGTDILLADNRWSIDSLPNSSCS